MSADGSKRETVKFEKTTDDIIRKMHGSILIVFCKSIAIWDHEVLDGIECLCMSLRCLCTC